MSTTTRPYCMQPRITVWSSILAAITERVKIVQLGNPLPTYDSPLQFAEEIAMIDMISQGRLVSGIVRGAGQESICLNSNPAYNRERFDEAHNLLVKAMTDDGPFAWEGEHFQYRVVNPWVRVLQRAASAHLGAGRAQPRDTDLGCASTATHTSRSTPPSISPGSCGRSTTRPPARVGYEPGPGEPRVPPARPCAGHRGEGSRRRPRVHVDARPVHRRGASVLGKPPGYGSDSRRLMYTKLANGLLPRSRAAPFEEQHRTHEIVAGTPDQCVAALRVVLETCRPSILMLWGNDGKVGHRDSRRCIELLGREVLPALREIGDGLGLHDPFELGTPISLALTPPHELHPTA